MTIAIEIWLWSKLKRFVDGGKVIKILYAYSSDPIYSPIN